MTIATGRVCSGPDLGAGLMGARVHRSARQSGLSLIQRADGSIVAPNQVLSPSLFHAPPPPPSLFGCLSLSHPPLSLSHFYWLILSTVALFTPFPHSLCLNVSPILALSVDIYLCVRVCVRACVCVWGGGGVCVRACVSLSVSECVRALLSLSCLPLPVLISKIIAGLSVRLCRYRCLMFNWFN